MSEQKDKVGVAFSRVWGGRAARSGEFARLRDARRREAGGMTFSLEVLLD